MLQHITASQGRAMQTTMLDFQPSVRRLAEENEAEERMRQEEEERKRQQPLDQPDLRGVVHQLTVNLSQEGLQQTLRQSQRSASPVQASHRPQGEAAEMDGYHTAWGSL